VKPEKRMLISPEVLLRFYKVTPIIIAHIGAHDAEEIELYRKVGWEDIYWIEANPDRVSALRANESVDSDRVIHGLVSDADGNEIDFNISNNSMSSSIFPMAKHKEIYPDVTYTHTLKLKTVRIDSIFKNRPRPDLINLDIQGSELKALVGALDILETTKWIYTEVSIKDLYEGAARIQELERFLRSQQFQRIAIRVNWKEGWGDALYINKNLVSIPIKLKLAESFLKLLWNANQILYLARLLIHKTFKKLTFL
jgi:FkbM family methyltransferase